MLHRHGQRAHFRRRRGQEWRQPAGQRARFRRRRGQERRQPAGQPARFRLRQAPAEWQTLRRALLRRGNRHRCLAADHQRRVFQPRDEGIRWCRLEGVVPCLCHCLPCRHAR